MTSTISACSNARTVRNCMPDTASDQHAGLRWCFQTQTREHPMTTCTQHTAIPPNSTVRLGLEAKTEPETAMWL